MHKKTQPHVSALKVVERLQDQGYLAYFAGGCVRDEKLGRTPKDYDVATNARPAEIEALFPQTIPIGRAFGVIAVIVDQNLIEVATFRKDIGISDGRHPETVAFCAAQEDAQRRDFTINGMFFDPVTNTLHDYVNGQRDLERKVIITIGDPVERFQEDHLRMLRAIRFTHTLGFALDPDTEAAISTMAHLITHISAERIELELTKMLTESARPGDALAHLLKVGLLQHILPEIIPMAGQKQPPQFHPEGDVFEHVVLMLNLMNEQASLPAFTPRELAYAILLHDVGKPATARMGPGTDGELRIRFDGHASLGAEMAETILTRLKFPNKERKHIVDAVRGHMRFMDVPNMRASTLRKMIGAEAFGLELELHRIDCLGSHGMLDTYDYLQNYMAAMANEPILPEPWLRGNDLLELGFTEGRLIGRILKEAYDAQMEDRFADRDALLDWVRSSHRPAGNE